MIQKIRALLTASLGSLGSLHAAEFYVASAGSDKATGTFLSPFQTIQRAYQQAGPGDTICLRKGTYREAVSLTHKSGKEGSPITLKAYKDEKPILSGLDVLKLDWMATAQHGVYVAPLASDPLRQLFFNGKPMLEARWPNVPMDATGEWNFFAPEVWSVVDHQGNHLGTIADEHLAATGWNVTGAQAMLNVEHQYFCWTRAVRSHTAGSHTFSYDNDLGDSVARNDETGNKSTFNDDRYYLFGMRQFLDAPGEWFYDAPAKKLYFYAPGGISPSAGVLESKTRDWGFTADQHSSHLTMDGLVFFGTAFKFGKDYNNKSSHIVIRKCTVLYSSWTEYVNLPKGGASARADQIYPTLEADDSQVVNSTFAYGALGALYINGFDNLVENNDFHDFCYNSSLGYPPLQVSKSWMVGRAGRATIRYNSLYRSGGIQAQIAQCNNDFYLNDIQDSFLACYGGNKDTSAIYTNEVCCKGTRIHHNWVHGGYSGTPPQAWGGGLGIRGDDKTSGLTVDHNVTWDLGAAGIEIKSADNPTPEQANRCINNTVFRHSGYNPKKGAIYICSILNHHNSQSTVANNLADSYYGWWGAKPLGKLKQFRNNTAAFNPNVDLVNPVWCDFRPAAGAAAIIDGGCAVEGVTGKVVGHAPDIGAYERGDSVYWIPGRRSGKASRPIVPDMAKNVPADRDVVMWRSAYRAVAHALYFSTSKEDVQRAAIQVRQATFQGEQNVFSLPRLSSGQAYYWRVDALMPDKSVIAGDVWTFSTQ